MDSLSQLVIDFFHFDSLLKKFFIRLIKNAPAFVPQSATTRRQADAS
jgi:hypothetical protein